MRRTPNGKVCVCVCVRAYHPAVVNAIYAIITREQGFGAPSSYGFDDPSDYRPTNTICTRGGGGGAGDDRHPDEIEPVEWAR